MVKIVDNFELIKAKLGAKSRQGQISCLVALKLAEQLKVKPRLLGEIADALKIRIINCQLGCFSKPGLKKSQLESERG